MFSSVESSISDTLELQKALCSLLRDNECYMSNTEIWLCMHGGATYSLYS